METVYTITLETPAGETLYAYTYYFRAKYRATMERKRIETDHPECVYRVVKITAAEAERMGFGEV